jgi:hypothetical protein
MPTIVSKTMNSTHKLEDIGTMHYVYLGGPDGGQIDSEYEQAAMDECSALFPSFSVTRATGMFRGKREETLIFHIAFPDAGKIMELANRLRERFHQDGVGVIRPTPQGGFYSRVVRFTPGHR